MNKIAECRQPIPPPRPHLFVLVILGVLANVALWIPHGCHTTWPAYTIHAIQDCVVPTSRSLVVALLLQAPSASSIATVRWVFHGGQYRRRDIRFGPNFLLKLCASHCQSVSNSGGPPIAPAAVLGCPLTGDSAAS